MPIFQVRVRKRHDTKLIEWENRYYVSGSGLSSVSLACLDMLIPAEQGIHNAGVTIIRQTTSDLPVGGDFIAVPLDAACTNGVSGEPLPIFLTLNCQFDTTGFGRLDRKYYHVCWGETGQNDGVWDSTPRLAVSSILNGVIADMFSNDTPICDVDGNTWQTAVVDAAVGSHKFSKRSKRAVAGP